LNRSRSLFKWRVLRFLASSQSNPTQLLYNAQTLKFRDSRRICIILWNLKINLPCSQELVTDPFPEPGESNPHSLICFSILSYMVRSSEGVSKLKRLVAGFPPRRPGFEPGSGQVGFVVDKVALEQASSEYFGFPCQFSFHRLPHTHHLSSGARKIDQLVADIPSVLVLPHSKKLNKN
jgi:hypothetical protein